MVISNRWLLGFFSPCVVVVDRVKKLGYGFFFFFFIFIHVCETPSIFTPSLFIILSQLLGDKANQINFSS